MLFLSHRNIRHRWVLKGLHTNNFQNKLQKLMLRACPSIRRPELCSGPPMSIYYVGHLGQIDLPLFLICQIKKLGSVSIKAPPMSDILWLYESRIISIQLMSQFKVSGPTVKPNCLAGNYWELMVISFIRWY